jgi:predicted GNAT family acetyltransferase
MTDIEVTDNPALHRYEARVDGVLAGFAAYRLEGERTVFTHTSVGDEWEGQGVASALARYALDDVVGAGRTITPICPFIAGYIARHPQYISSGRGPPSPVLDLISPTLARPQRVGTPAGATPCAGRCSGPCRREPGDRGPGRRR